MRKRGAPKKADVSLAVKDYLQWLLIDGWQSEPHQQNQNFAERRYQDVKRLAYKILDRTGAPMRYACFVYNHTAANSLDWKTPMSILTGAAPDISVLLRFTFYEKVYYKTSPESLGYFVGISENVGHAMTYKILNPETNSIIFRSEVRSAYSPNDPNWHLTPSDAEESTPPTIIKSRSDNFKIDSSSDSFKSIVYSSVDESDDDNALVNNKDLIGRTFLLAPDDKGHPSSYYC